MAEKQSTRQEQSGDAATRSGSIVSDVDVDPEEVIEHGRAVSILRYRKDDIESRDGKVNSVMSPVRAGTKSSTPWSADHRDSGRGRMLNAHLSGSSSSSSAEQQRRYKPYRKAERILGMTLPPSKEVGHDTQPGQPGGDGANKSAPDVRHQSAPESVSRSSSPRSMRLPLSSNPVQNDGFPSHEISKPPTKPVSTDDTSNPKIFKLSTNLKRVSHLLPPVSTDGPSNFSRQYVTRTPYPPVEKPNPSPLSTESWHFAPCLLHLCLQRKNNNPPKFTSIVIPGRQQSTNNGSEESKSKTQRADFDDEQLFLLLKIQYRNLQGPIRRFISLRTLTSLQLIHSSPNSLEVLGTGHVHSTLPTNSHLTQSLLLDHYQKPRRGRGEYMWTDWIHHLSGSLAQFPADNAPLTVEFIDGWSVPEIVLLGSCFLLLSLSAGPLWIVFGVDAQGATGFDTVGARVHTGLLLSGVVLLLSWSVLALWIALSWLIM